MAGEIQFSFRSGATCYILIRDRTGQIWNGSAFVTYATINFSIYPVQAAEQGSASGLYAATFPATIVPGVYNIVAKQQLGGSPAESDPTVATGDEQWNGTVTLPLSDLATSGQVGLNTPIRIFRGQMVQNFPFKMVSSIDHISAFLSGVVSGQILRDGGSFGVLQSGNFTERGLGWYSINLTSGDLLANTVALEFSAVGVSGGMADNRSISLILQRTSGQ